MSVYQRNSNISKALLFIVLLLYFVNGTPKLFVESLHGLSHIFSHEHSPHHHSDHRSSVSHSHEHHTIDFLTKLLPTPEKTPIKKEAWESLGLDKHVIPSKNIFVFSMINQKERPSSRIATQLAPHLEISLPPPQV